MIAPDTLAQISIFHRDPAELGRIHRLISAASHLLTGAMELGRQGKLRCQIEGLNPCWDNRPDDVPGQHWASEGEDIVSACPTCRLRAAITIATGDAS